MKRRPAETTTGLLASGGLAVALSQHNWLAAGLAAIGYVPVIVTWLTHHGGIKGALTDLWTGEPAHPKDPTNQEATP
jgi:hypothetical protein